MHLRGTCTDWYGVEERKDLHKDESFCGKDTKEKCVCVCMCVCHLDFTFVEFIFFMCVGETSQAKGVPEATGARPNLIRRLGTYLKKAKKHNSTFWNILLFCFVFLSFLVPFSSHQREVCLWSVPIALSFVTRYTSLLHRHKQDLLTQCRTNVPFFGRYKSCLILFWY